MVKQIIHRQFWTFIATIYGDIRDGYEIGFATLNIYIYMNIHMYNIYIHTTRNLSLSLLRAIIPCCHDPKHQRFLIGLLRGPSCCRKHPVGTLGGTVMVRRWKGTWKTSLERLFRGSKPMNLLWGTKDPLTNYLKDI